MSVFIGTVQAVKWRFLFFFLLVVFLLQKREKLTPYIVSLSLLSSTISPVHFPFLSSTKSLLSSSCPFAQMLVQKAAKLAEKVFLFKVPPRLTEEKGAKRRRLDLNKVVAQLLAATAEVVCVGLEVRIYIFFCAVAKSSYAQDKASIVCTFAVTVWPRNVDRTHTTATPTRIEDNTSVSRFQCTLLVPRWSKLICGPLLRYAHRRCAELALRKK